MDKKDVRLFIDRELLEVDTLEKVYRSRFVQFEGDSSAWSAAPTIEIYDTDSTSGTAQAPDSWSLIDGTFTYTSDQNDQTRYLTGWSYDIHRAAGRLFMRLAAKESITASAGETGGAIRGRSELRWLAQMQFVLARTVSRSINRVYNG